MGEARIIARVSPTVLDVDSDAWNALLAQQTHPTPFMRHEYLAALEASGSATPATGWTPRFVTLWEDDAIIAACPLYLKSHSYGEYVFDWAWASAYEQHGVAYYPKAIIAVPFTPVPGSRLLARDAACRALLIQAVCQWCGQEGISSLHILFASADDLDAGAQLGLMQRHTVQFHWKNVAPTLHTDVSSLPPEGALAALGRPGGGSEAPTLRTDAPWCPREESAANTGRLDGGSSERFTSFEHFLSSLAQDKRKKIRQERRRVADAGVSFRWSRGADISLADWDFFYRCYERTYLEHGNPPYLTRDFFARMAEQMPEAWLLFVAEREGRPIATSLIAISALSSSARAQKDDILVAYGRYWGALERVDCLHFEACYYQPLQWCIDHGVSRFEGGAQGEHKMARALLPVQTSSMHWLAHPAFADAVERFLEREGAGVADYLGSLNQRLPFKRTA